MANDSIFEGLDPEVAAVLNDARRTSPVAPHAGLIASMAAAVASAPLVPQPSLPRRKTMIGKLVTAKVLGIVGALALTGGAAAAATGTLPDPVQNTASDAAEHVGVHIPQGDHGAAVSSVAHDKSTDGDGNHGQNVSNTAKDNHGHEGDSTSTTEVGDNGPGNSKGHANGHSSVSKSHTDGTDETDGTNDDAEGTDDEVTTTTIANTPTTADDNGGTDDGASHGGSHSTHGSHG